MADLSESSYTASQPIFWYNDTNSLVEAQSPRLMKSSTLLSDSTINYMNLVLRMNHDLSPDQREYKVPDFMCCDDLYMYLTDQFYNSWAIFYDYIRP